MNNIYYERPQKPQKNNSSKNSSPKNPSQQIEEEYFQPSYQEQEYFEPDSQGAAKHEIKELVSNIILVFLSIVLVLNVCVAVNEISDMNYSWDREEDSFWYDINDGRYALLVGNSWTNRYSDIEQTDGLEQCYAVADYFEAASLYKVAVCIGDVEKQEKYAKIMEEKLAYFSDIMYIAEEINMKLGIE